MGQSILSNTAIATGGRIINVALGVLVMGLITRYLGASQFGLYTILLSFGAIIQLLADGGLYLTLTREIGIKPDRTQQIVSQIVSLRLVLLVGAFIPGILLIRFIPAIHGLESVFFIIAIGLSFQSISQLAMGIYQHYGEVWRATVGDLTGRIIQISIILSLGAASARLNYIAYAFAASAIAAWIIHTWLLPRGTIWRPQLNRTGWKKIIISSWPLGLVLLLNAVFFRIDTVILSLFRSPLEVGWYGIAYRIVESSLFFPAMFGGLLLPRLAKALGKQKKVAQGYLSEGLRLLFIIALFAVTICLTRSEGIIHLIAGRGYEPAAPLLRILSLALPIMFLGNLFGFTLVALGKQIYLLKLYMLLVGLNIVMNLIFIPSFGATAAAWTTVATEGISAAAAALVVWRLIHPRGSLLIVVKVLLISLTTAGLITFVMPTINLILQIIIAAIFYFAASFYSGAISKRHLRLLSSRHAS